MFELTTRPLFNDRYVTVALVGVALVGLLWLGPAKSRTTRGKRMTLIGIRLLSIALVLLAMIRPAAVYTATDRQQAMLVILLDGSRSMSVADAAGDRSRWNAMRSALDDVAQDLALLHEELETQFFLFDGQLRPLESKEGRVTLAAEPTGEATALGAALDDLRQRVAGKRLAGVILITDGAQRALPPRDTPPQLPARQFKELGYRLFPVPLGQAVGAGQLADVALADLLVSPTVFMKNQLVVSGSLRVNGYVGRPIVVQLLWEVSPGKLEVVDTVSLTAGQDGQQLPVQLSYAPPEPGERRLAMKVVDQPGETVLTNNELSTYVTVLEGGVNLLYMEGIPRPETPGIRRALGRSQDIHLDFLRWAADDSAGRPDDLLQRFAPGKYDAYILGDLDATGFKPAELEALAHAVGERAGLVMLGGVQSFGPGEYYNSPLADVLPVAMDRFERQRPGDATRKDLHLAGPVKMRPTRAGEELQFLLLDAPQRNADVWEKLPPLDGANKLKPKPTAQVLAETPDKQPLLIVDNYGGGRVIAFAGDSTWRWRLGGEEALHERFWRQLALWLARKEQDAAHPVWIRLDERRYAPGAKVEFQSGARGAQGEPLDDVTLDVVVKGPDGASRPVRLSGGAGAATGIYAETQAPGEYQISVTGARQMMSHGAASARFIVYSQDMELDNPAADPTTLASLAAMTGGRTVAPEQLPQLMEELKLYPQQLEIKVETRKELYDNGYVLAAIVGLFCLEWFLRKRFGLV